jgi:hypothetical protein
MQKENQNKEILEKKSKTPKSKNFTCLGLNFESLANLGSNEVRLAKTGLNFEIPLKEVVRFLILLKFS